MMCKYCKEDRERIEQGYDARNIQCECTWNQRREQELKFLLSLLVIAPITLLLVAIFVPIRFTEKVVKWLEN